MVCLLFYSCLHICRCRWPCCERPQQCSGCHTGTHLWHGHVCRLSGMTGLLVRCPLCSEHHAAQARRQVPAGAADTSEGTATAEPPHGRRGRDRHKCLESSMDITLLVQVMVLVCQRERDPTLHVLVPASMWCWPMGDQGESHCRPHPWSQQWWECSCAVPIPWGALRLDACYEREAKGGQGGQVKRDVVILSPLERRKRTQGLNSPRAHTPPTHRTHIQPRARVEFARVLPGTCMPQTQEPSPGPAPLPPRCHPQHASHPI